MQTAGFNPGLNERWSSCLKWAKRRLEKELGCLECRKLIGVHHHLSFPLQLEGFFFWFKMKLWIHSSSINNAF